MIYLCIFSHVINPKEANMAENNTEKRQETVQVDFERRLSGEAMQESIVAMSHLDDNPIWSEQ